MHPAFRLLSEAQTFRLILSTISMALLKAVNPRNDVIYRLTCSFYSNKTTIGKLYFAWKHKLQD